MTEYRGLLQEEGGGQTKFPLAKLARGRTTTITKVVAA